MFGHRKKSLIEAKVKKIESFLEEVLINNGVWSFGDDDYLASFEYETGVAIPVFSSRENASDGEESKSGDQIVGLNLYEFIFYVIPSATLKWDVDTFAIYNGVDEPVFFSDREFEKIMLNALEERYDNGREYYHFEESGFHPQRESNPKELASIMKAPPQTKYRHLLSHAAVNRTIWCLTEGESLTTVDNSKGEPALLIWPVKEWAEAVAERIYPGHEAVSVNIFEFLYEILPSFEEQFNCQGRGAVASASLEEETCEDYILDSLTLQTEGFMCDFLEELERY